MVFRTQTIDYRHDGLPLEGFFAFNDTPDKRPGILVVHEWMGVNDYIRSRAEQIARLGYVAFAADIFGKGVRPKDPQAAAAEAAKYRNDRQLLRARVNAALEVLRKHPKVDQNRICAIGYCFGGTAVLELARSGARIAGVVSIHGGLDASRETSEIRTRVLALHGADDPFVPAEQVAAFEQEMRNAKVDWQLVKYGGAVHSFTNPYAGDDPRKGSAYNRSADARSWGAMLQFLEEIFGEGPEQ